MNTVDQHAFISKYLDSIKELYYRGDATEHSYRATLQQLIHGLFPDHIAINERKRVDVGAPDLVIFKRNDSSSQRKAFNDIPLGFIEAKDIITGILDRPEHQEQIKRYMELGNVVHTDGLEFRFYFNKELVKTLSIARLNDSKQIVEKSENYEDLVYYLKQTISQAGQTVRTAKSLALLMADRARPIRRTIKAALMQDIDAGERTTLTDQYSTFRETLIHDLTTEDFADIYAETIAYGLFAARYNDDTADDFSLGEAAEKVPQTNPFLRQFFLQIAAYEKDPRLDWVLNNFVELFLRTNVHNIMANYGKTTGMNHDPVTHFYETFLGEYDSKRRKARGVYYTPLPIVQHIVKAVDAVLKEEFGLTDGLADDSTIKHTYNVDPYRKGKGTGKQHYTKTEDIPRVQILDPATGTGTFLNETIKLIAERKRNLGNGWSSYVENNLLPRLHGFELLMAAYSMAHMRLGLTLEESGYTPSQKHPRLGVYLTNTLEEPAKEEPPLLAMLGMGRAITEEATAADKIKRDLPIMVVMGNPPYSVSSSNKSKYIDDLMADYKKDLNEKNIQPLSDDYIKFIRYAESMVEKTGTGIVAIITNNSYIDGLIHRQMRKHLLQTFDSIRVIDLHGNSKKKETAPDGSTDENVFDIQQGVSIVIMSKTTKSKTGLAKVHFSEFYGKRTNKYQALEKEVLTESINPVAPSYYFVKKDTRHQKEFGKMIPIDELFTSKTSGVETRKDSLVTNFEESPLKNVVEDFQTLNSEILAEKYNIDNKSRDWKIEWAQADLKANSVLIRDIDYKILSKKKIIYTGKTKGINGYPMYNVFQHMLLGKNYGLILMRKLVDSQNFSSVFISTGLVDKNFYGFQTYTFPLYLYDHGSVQSPNINKLAAQRLVENLKLKTRNETVFLKYTEECKERDYSKTEPYFKKENVYPLDLLDYTYGILHSRAYRDKYKEFLKTDFPRIPKPLSGAEFWRLAQFGNKLRNLHLIRNVEAYVAPLSGKGSRVVEKLNYQEGAVYINETQYFPNIPEIAWKFYIGGYQPAQKWLKDHKGRELSHRDIEHYQKIIKILIDTDRIMKEIDS